MIMIDGKTLTDMTGVDCLNVNGKVYISLNEVYAILDGYQSWRPDSIETTSYIRRGVEYAHETGRTLKFDLYGENSKRGSL